MGLNLAGIAIWNGRFPGVDEELLSFLATQAQEPCVHPAALETDALVCFRVSEWLADRHADAMRFTQSGQVSSAAMSAVTTTRLLHAPARLLPSDFEMPSSSVRAALRHTGRPQASSVLNMKMIESVTSMMDSNSESDSGSRCTCTRAFRQQERRLSAYLRDCREHSRTRFLRLQPHSMQEPSGDSMQARSDSTATLSFAESEPEFWGPSGRRCRRPRQQVTITITAQLLVHPPPRHEGPALLLKDTHYLTQTIVRQQFRCGQLHSPVASASWPQHSIKTS